MTLAILEEYQGSILTAGDAVGSKEISKAVEGFSTMTWGTIEKMLCFGYEVYLLRVLKRLKRLKCNYLLGELHLNQQPQIQCPLRETQIELMLVALQ